MEQTKRRDESCRGARLTHVKVATGDVTEALRTPHLEVVRPTTHHIQITQGGQTPHHGLNILRRVEVVQPHEAPTHRTQ